MTENKKLQSQSARTTRADSRLGFTGKVDIGEVRIPVSAASCEDASVTGIHGEDHILLL